MYPFEGENLNIITYAIGSKYSRVEQCVGHVLQLHKIEIVQIQINLEVHSGINCRGM